MTNKDQSDNLNNDNLNDIKIEIKNNAKNYYHGELITDKQNQ